jgi:lysophospholipase L1-like esterase
MSRSNLAPIGLLSILSTGFLACGAEVGGNGGSDATGGGQTSSGGASGSLGSGGSAVASDAGVGVAGTGGTGANTAPTDAGRDGGSADVVGGGSANTGGRGGSTGVAGTGGARATGGAPGSGGANGSGGAAGAGAQARVTVWIAGDSTVATGTAPCPIGWGGQFKPYFNDLVSVTNSAVAGRSVRTWLYNVQTVMDPATGECVLTRDASGNPTVQARWQAMLNGMKAGDYLFIQFGINDSDPTCDRHVGLEAFKQTYGVMAQAAKDRGTQPIFVTPTSSIACTGTTARGTRGGYVTATLEAGVQYAVPVIDLHALSVALYTSLAFCPVPGGDVSAATTGPVGDFFCDDHTHFSSSGAVQIASLVAKALRDQGIGLGNYLR